MTGIYVRDSEAKALNAIDLRALEAQIDEAVQLSRSGTLYDFRLGSCGIWVSRQWQKLDEAIAAHNQAKAPKKRAETYLRLRQAGSDLQDAVSDMKRRVAEEASEQLRFVVEDLSFTPRTLTPDMRARVSYQWRDSPESDWTFGTIAFLHQVDMTPDYSSPKPKRQPRWKQEEEQQDRLYRIWEQLRNDALQSVREYLQSGKDRTRIPEEYQVTTDSYTRGLNNFSTDFWRAFA